MAPPVLGPKKTSGNKHLELQRALKAQYSSRVAEKRQQQQRSPIKEYFADKQDRRKSQERNALRTPRGNDENVSARANQAKSATSTRPQQPQYAKNKKAAVKQAYQM